MEPQTLIREHAASVAPPDVVATLDWLEKHGFDLVRAETGTMGNICLEYVGETGFAVVTRERGQWMLDVASGAEDPLIQFDIAVAAARDMDYRDMPVHGRDVSMVGGLPDQLPYGVSWATALPEVLTWLGTTYTADALARVLDQRWVQMWPDSHKARDIRRRWASEGAGD